MARQKTKTAVHVRLNSELLTAIDKLADESGETRTDLIEEGMRWVVATRHSREVSRRRREPEE